MQHTTLVRSWSAIGVGVFFTLVTCFVLLEDVRHGAPITVKHVMTLAVLAGTIYFGHRWWLEARQVRIGTAIGCAVLFLAGTAMCVIVSAGRNAEVTMTSTHLANSANADRARAVKERNEAKTAYQDAVAGNDPRLVEAKAAWSAAVTAAQLECGSGEGDKCKAKRATIAQHRTVLETAELNHRALLMILKEDLEKAEAALASQKPEQIANPEIKSAAALISKFPGVSASADAVEAMLLLLEPFLKSLFCEIAAIVGYGIGLGHGQRKVSSRAETDAKGKTTPEGSGGPGKLRKPSRETVTGKPTATVVKGPWLGKPFTKAAALVDLQAYIQQHGCVPSQDFLKARWGLKSKGTPSKWLGQWERSGLISRRQDGRCKVVESA